MITQDDKTASRLSSQRLNGCVSKDKAEFEAYQKEVAGGVRFAPVVLNAVSPRCGCGLSGGRCCRWGVDGTDRWMGAIPGAVMGAAVGEFGQQVYDKATNSAYAPVDAGRGATRIAKEAAFSAIGEGAGRAITFVRPVAYAKPTTLSAEQMRTKPSWTGTRSRTPRPDHGVLVPLVPALRRR